ncbi:MAG: YbhB/YbcL family Raf kinase inhibitor-like protein [Ilumatobacteraceae bacterium]
MTFEARVGRCSTRLTPVAIAVSLGVLIAACSSDGREMAPPRADQRQTIIDGTTAPTVIDGSLELSTTPLEVFTLTAPWNDGQPIPIDHTCSGDGVSPPLVWSGAPIETQSFALVVTDLDATGPTGAPLVHWVVANIDPFVTTIGTGGSAAGAIEGVNDLGRPDVPIVGWSPPCPPNGETHTYLVTLYALSQRLEFLDGTPGADLIRAIELASLASTGLTGTVSS